MKGMYNPMETEGNNICSYVQLISKEMVEKINVLFQKTNFGNSKNTFEEGDECSSFSAIHSFVKEEID